MRGADDHVNRIGAMLEDLRQCLNDVLDALVSAENSESQNYEFAFDSEMVFIKTRIGKRHVINAVRYENHLVVGHAIAIAQKFDPLIAHRHHALRMLDNLRQALRAGLDWVGRESCAKW